MRALIVKRSPVGLDSSGVRHNHPDVCAMLKSCM